MHHLRPKNLVLAICVAVVSFLLGAVTSIEIHGDWILIRHTAQCAAYNPDKGAIVGTWSPVAGRCHMSDFIWKRIFPL